MTLGILFALVVMPVSILAVSIFCYIIQTKLDKKSNEIMQNQQASQINQDEKQVGGAK
ncbi:hypothetical protein ACE1TI_21270 [Alteribacillus sp. JSM 102045]|uniref:hypothetical protein n=1 Tax=Alteribacillus sp. JSM 102045 TaxID=1562101 RepID=UPI0035BF29F6